MVDTATQEKLDVFKKIIFEGKEVSFLKFSVAQMNIVGEKSLHNIIAWAEEQGLKKSTPDCIKAFREEYEDQEKGTWMFFVSDSHDECLWIMERYHGGGFDTEPLLSLAHDSIWQNEDEFVFEVA
jgi:hypothetical protein